jgi:class 3 adenylate cyclase
MPNPMMRTCLSNLATWLHVPWLRNLGQFFSGNRLSFFAEDPPQFSPGDLGRSPNFLEYRAWQRRFLHQRLHLVLSLAILAYLTFILFTLSRQGNGLPEQAKGWLMMAGIIEAGLWLCLWIHRSRWGYQHPAVIFLGTSWLITLVEQIWASLNGFALPGLYSWTLTFLVQATLVPVRWRLHVISQLGVFAYYYGVNTWLSLRVPTDLVADGRQGLYLIWFCLFCSGSVYLYERLQRSEFFARRELEIERNRSERLLLNILPEAVAQKLKQDQRTIAESFAEASVLFADVVGFTELSSGIPPRELVELLNQIFSQFDALAEKHQLEKIKTIGDSYMVVGGLPIERSDHLMAIANMALDMQQAIAQVITPSGKPLQIRIGINTGPVVAGVIGRKKFIYDLWGDTVNVASRMESQGIAGGIQVTEAVYEQLHLEYAFERRGLVSIKGKGEMMTYLLLGHSPVAV